MLSKEVSKEEFKLVKALLKRDKSPGPDGWPIEFFIGFYELLEEDLIKVIEEVRNSGKVQEAFKCFIHILNTKNGLAS